LDGEYEICHGPYLKPFGTFMEGAMVMVAQKALKWLKKRSKQRSSELHV